MNKTRRLFKNEIKRTLTTEVLENPKSFQPYRKKIDLVFDAMEVKNFAFYSGDATMLEQLDIVDMRQLSIGMFITLQETGAPAHGDFVMPDGSTLKIIKGRLSKIIEADPD